MRPVVLAALSLTLASSAYADEADCKRIEDPRSRFRCTDELATAVISRAKAAVRRQLREPDIAVFYNMQIKSGGMQVCGEFDLEREGVPTGLRRFAYDGQKAFVLLRNATDAAPSKSSSVADRLKTLGEAINAYDRTCSAYLPVPHGRWDR